MGKKMVRSVMKRPWGKSLWLGMVATLSCQAEAPQRFEFEKMGMGTLFRISMVAPDLATAERAAERAFARMDSLEKTLSDWDPASEVRKLSQEGGRTRVSDDLWEVLALSIQVARATEGAFDPTVGPAVRLWRRARRQGELPTPADLEAALKRMGWENLEVGDSPWIVLKVSGMRLDLGGVGKGFALDAMLKTLADEGIKAALVDGGGDLAASGPPPGKKGWRVRGGGKTASPRPPGSGHFGNSLSKLRGQRPKLGPSSGPPDRDGPRLRNPSHRGRLLGSARGCHGFRRLHSGPRGLGNHSPEGRRRSLVESPQGGHRMTPEEPMEC